MKKNTTLQNKIKAYSTIALSIAGIGMVHSQIVYHDVIPDKVLTGSDPTFNIDMDGNATDDFQAQTDGSIRAQLNNLITANNGVVGYGSSAWYYAKAFALGETIGPSTSYWNNAGRNILASAYSTSSSGWGFFGDEAEHYAGVKFQIGSNVHYGWIRFDDIPNNGTTITIMDWAYNSVANTAITAGTTGVGIIENSNPKNIAVNYHNKKVNVIYLDPNEKGSIRITNLMGQEIKNVDITDSKMSINMSDVTSGIYMVTINNGKNNFTRKVSVN
jgi:hypothetical protein